ncbi:hypothetical protein V6N13_049874 [Hibiscus sabdariffa]
MSSAQSEFVITIVNASLSDSDISYIRKPDSFSLLQYFNNLNFFLLFMSTSTLIDWKKLFKCTEDQSLEFISHVIYDGVPTAQPPSEVFDDRILEWKHALVGQFIGYAPKFTSLQSIVAAIWETLRKTLTYSKQTVDDSPVLGTQYAKTGFGFNENTSLASTLQCPIGALYQEGSKLYLQCDWYSSSYGFCHSFKRDGCTVQIRIQTPWIPPCCTYSKLYGHSNTCTVKGDKAKTVQVWQVKKPDLNGKSDNTDGKSDLTVNAEEQQSETGAKTRVSNPVDTIVEPITHCTQLLPELGISNPVRKSVKKDKKSGASTKKFEVLAKDADGKKTRAAAQGVTELLQDLKSKKKAHYDKALPEVHVSSGGG